MTKFFAKAGEDYGPTGWVTEKGEFIVCGPFEHDAVAWDLTKEPLRQTEKRWVRIGLYMGKNHIQFAGKRLTKKQIKAVDEWGILDYAERHSVLMDKNFINAYFGEATTNGKEGK